MDDFLQAHACSVLKVTSNSERGHDDGQVCFDSVFRVVKDRPGFQIGLAHTEGLFYVP